MNCAKIMLTVALLGMTAAHAGVEIDMVTRDAAGTDTGTMKIYTQAGRVRMDGDGTSSKDKVSMIFRNQELLLLDHKDHSYMLLDEASMAKAGGQLDAAMQQMQAQLASMPAEQRAMMEQMMKGQMGGMMAGRQDPPPAPIVQKMGTGNWESGTCTEYSVSQGGEKTQEICAAALGDLDGAGEAMQAFRDMAAFLQKTLASMPGPMAARMAHNPMGLIDQIQGFPVRTRDFSGGQLREETTLEGMREQGLDEALFEVPDGYKRRDAFGAQ